MLKNLKNNLGTRKVENLENVFSSIREIMKNEGYNVEKCDICSVEVTQAVNKCHVLFKFVHYSVPTMANEPYWLITLATDTTL